MPIFENTITITSRVIAADEIEAAKDALLNVCSHKERPNVVSQDVKVNSRNCGPSSDEILAAAKEQG